MLGYKEEVLVNHFKNAPHKMKLIIGDKDHIIKPDGILPIVEKMGSFQIHHLPLKHHQLAKPEVAELLLID